MNPFSPAPFLSNEVEDLIESDVDEAEQQKADRIAFHRARVRNGPVSYKDQTSGQVRRAKARDFKGRTRKTRRAQVQAHLTGKLASAILRGKLQQAGVLPYEHGGVVDPIQQVRATVWLVNRFGVDVEGEMSFLHDDVLIALSNALEAYGRSIGREDLQVPEGYVVPVYAEVVA